MSEDGWQVCFMLLSCIGVGPQYFMPLSDDFHGKFKLVSHINNYAPSIPDQMATLEAEIHAANVFIHHTPEWLPLMGDSYTAYERMLADIPASVTKISYPLPEFHALWPFHTHEPRLDDPNRPLNRHGELPEYGYGDTYVLALLDQGVPPEEIISRYLELDVSTAVDLDQLMSWTLSLLERNDRTTDIKVEEFVRTTVRSQSLFETINHGNNRLHLYLANEILKRLECATLPDTILDRTRPLTGSQMPIHPSIARHFGVTYADETTRYLIDELRNLTFAEYIREYVYFS